MDPPGSENTGPGGGSDRDLVYAKNFKDRIAHLSKEAQALVSIGAPWRDEARHQILSALPQSELPLYMTLFGVNRERLIAHGEALISTIAGANNRSLESTQVQAIADNLMSNARSTAVLEWGLFGGTLLMTYRHRNRVPANFLRRAPGLVRWVWPPVVFFMYSIPVSLFLQPVVIGLNARSHASRLKADPRVKGLNVDLSGSIRRAMEHDQQQQSTEFQQSSGAEESSSGLREQAALAYRQSREQMESAAEGNDWPSNRQDDSPASSRSSPPAWNTPDNQTSRNSLWDDDDASPIAPAYQSPSGSKSITSTSGSTWDRIRQQSHQQQPPSRKNWANTTPAPGTAADSDSHRLSSSGYNPYSEEDKIQTREREHAQRDFDRMLERDRQQASSGGDSWRR